MQATALTVLDSIDVASVQNTLSKIASFQAIIQNQLRKGQDYDDIAGGKPTLLKAGAEKIVMLFGVSPDFYTERMEDFDKGLFSYNVKCTLKKNELPVAQGVGNCNSMEKKYRFINVSESEVPEHLDIDSLPRMTDNYGNEKYKIPNPDIYSLVNTFLKMAKKRAFVDAALQLASLSDVFTQDLEDLKDFTQREKAAANESMTVEQASALKITFGKYKGSTLGEITKSDKKYAIWLLDNAKEANVRNAVKLLLNASKQSKSKSAHEPNVYNNAPPPDDDIPYYDPETGEVQSDAYYDDEMPGLPFAPEG